ALPGEGNIISGNGTGVFLTNVALRNTIQGNRIGTDPSGSSAVGNTTGILFDSFTGTSDNIVGGVQTGAGNLISGNSDAGISLRGNSNQVQGNWIGIDATGAHALGNGTGMIAAGSGNIIGGTTVGARNIISGNLGEGISLQGSQIAIEGNYIGTDP